MLQTNIKNDYEFHHFADIFPLMNNEELTELSQDIEKNGLLEPIVIYENKILDGRNRYRACKLLNLSLKIIVFEETCEPFDYVISLNLHRRHLNAAQRSELGVVILSRESEKAKVRQLKELKQFENTVPSSEEGTVDSELEGEALAIASSKVQIGRETLWKVTKIKEKAKTDPEIQASWDKALTGKKSIKSVYNEYKQKTRKEALKQLSQQPLVFNGQILEGDFFDVISQVPDNSIDLLFVDPPYNILDLKWDTFENLTDFLTFTEQWLKLSIKKVKSSGRIYICFGQRLKYALYNLLEQNNFFGFNFGQELIWHYDNNNKPSNRKMYRFAYDPIFYLYGKDADELNFPPETYGETQTTVWTIAQPQSNFKEGKFNEAQKPLELLRRIILTGSKKGDFVLDSFAGSGTTGIVCEQLQRNYILIEKRPEQVELIKGRIAEVIV